MTRCKACNRPITWARSEKGRMLPLEKCAHAYEIITEMQPDIVATTTEPTMPIQAFRRGGIYISHFLTCPKANDFSGKGK